MGVTIWLGNHQPVAVVETDTTPDGRPVHTRVPAAGHQCTIVEPPDGATTTQIIADLAAPDGIWARHSDAPTPAWVAATDPDLATVLAGMWGCELRQPAPEV